MARPGLRNHPKFRRLVHLLRPMPEVYVEAHLEAMWRVGYENGNPVLGDDVDVELAAEWSLSGREPGEWFKAIVDCRWIDKVSDQVYQIHDLLENAPDYVRKRAKRHAERKSCHTAEQFGGQRRTTAAERRTTADNGRPPSTQHPAPNGGMNSPIPPSSPAETGETKKARRPRKRDPLFDALAEITGSDPLASGSYIGRVCKALRAADPPYTPEDVRHLPGALTRYGLTVPVTLGVVEKYVGWLRHQPANVAGSGRESDPPGELPTGPQALDWASQFDGPEDLT